MHPGMRHNTAGFLEEPSGAFYFAWSHRLNAPSMRPIHNGGLVHATGVYIMLHAGWILPGPEELQSTSCLQNHLFLSMHNLYFMALLWIWPFHVM